jgi:hypothetical protein
MAAVEIFIQAVGDFEDSEPLVDIWSPKLHRWKSLSTPLETLRIQNHVTQIIIKYNSSQYSKEDKTQWRIDCSCERQGLGLRTLFGRGVNNHPGG